jgi:hypothetical protein
MTETKLTEPEPLDEDIIGVSLQMAAHVYECKAGGCVPECHKGRNFSLMADRALDNRMTDQATARAFAWGVSATMATMIVLPESLPANMATYLAFLTVEALRRGGDITDAQIEEARAAFVERKRRVEMMLTDVAAYDDFSGICPRSQPWTPGD